MITGGFTDDEIKEMKADVALMMKEQPHPSCSLRDANERNNPHIMHWYTCPSRITARFTDLIVNLLGERPKDKWTVHAADHARFDIYGPEIVVKVCGGRIGKMDGKRSKEYELQLLSRRDLNGNIDYTKEPNRQSRFGSPT
jgi:hypothetical protein